MADETTAGTAEPKPEIFISRNNQTHGPYPRQVVELWINTGKINRYDLACTDKTPWQPVAQLLWPVQHAKATSSLTGKQWALIIVAITLFIVFIGVASSFDKQQTSSLSASSSDKQQTSLAPSSSTYEPSPESPKEAALHNVSLDFKWSTGGFGSVMIADFTITNRSNYTVKDLDVTCTHSANSGTKIDSNSRTIYETVPAHSKKVIRDFNMGFIHSQATRSSCEITDLVVQ